MRPGLDADDRPVTRQPKAGGAEVLESDAEGPATLTPNPAESRTAGPQNEENRPAAVVRVLPEVVETEIEEDAFHKLDELKAEAEFTVVWRRGDRSIGLSDRIRRWNGG